ncbi:MAG: stage V sporulation protein AD, partial [Clostridia bacterium]|nr:stage V sporulation protein AD [Clostridia bacterium]
DCGELVYNAEEKEYQGGSGAGCSSMVFCSYLYKKLREKSLKRILLMSTGALLSSLSAQQGESIPGIAHAVSIES